MMKKKRPNRSYKKTDDMEEMQRWMNLYPWYRNLVEDIRETMSRHDRRASAEYRRADSRDVA